MDFKKVFELVLIILRWESFKHKYLSLNITFNLGYGFKIQGENMTQTMNVGQTVGYTASAASPGVTLSGLSATSADTTIATVTADAASNTGVVTAVAAGTTTITYSATGSDGAALTATVTHVFTVPDTLVITFGTPV